MAKFKVGDWVRVVKGNLFGKEGAVSAIHMLPDASYSVKSTDFTCGTAYFSEGSLELATRQFYMPNVYPAPGLDFEKAPTEAAPCLNLELAPYPCSCEMRELLMHGCKCGGY